MSLCLGSWSRGLPLRPPHVSADWCTGVRDLAESGETPSQAPAPPPKPFPPHGREVGGFSIITGFASPAKPSDSLEPNREGTQWPTF